MRVKSKPVKRSLHKTASQSQSVSDALEAMAAALVASVKGNKGTGRNKVVSVPLQCPHCGATKATRNRWSSHKSRCRLRAKALAD